MSRRNRNRHRLLWWAAVSGFVWELLWRWASREPRWILIDVSRHKWATGGVLPADYKPHNFAATPTDYIPRSLWPPSYGGGGDAL